MDENSKKSGSEIKGLLYSFRNYFSNAVIYPIFIRVYSAEPGVIERLKKARAVTHGNGRISRLPL